jgi:SAM-dependent methyltransferase
VDWCIGRYEQIAQDLLPAASAVISRAAPAPDEQVMDVGCGTGNAALLAAERGAQVTGVDPAERLLEIARAQAAARGLDVAFALAEAEALPLADGVADAVVSVFGVIFAPQASAAVAEMARVTAPGGRIVLSAWVPEGPIAAVARLRSEAVAAAVGEAAHAPSFAWHDSGALAETWAKYGFSVGVQEHSLAFTGASPADFLEAELYDHPAWVGARAVLEPRGEVSAVRQRALAVLEHANLDPAAFRVISRYVVATMRRCENGVRAETLAHG